MKLVTTPREHGPYLKFSRAKVRISTSKMTSAATGISIWGGSEIDSTTAAFGNVLVQG